MNATEAIAGRELHGGHGEGPVLKLDVPVSFWGGIDSASGRIVDRAHPQHGCSVVGTVLAMAGSRGSSGTPGVLAELLRSGTGPAAIVVTKPDVNLVAGALVAATLYDVQCPIVLVDDQVFSGMCTGERVCVLGEQ